MTETEWTACAERFADRHAIFSDLAPQILAILGGATTKSGRLRSYCRLQPQLERHEKQGQAGGNGVENSICQDRTQPTGFGDDKMVENLSVMTDDAFVVWASALEAGYLSASDVERWADEQILTHERPPGWLLDLSLTSSTETAANLLWSGWRQQVEANGCLTPLHERSGELYLGFLFMRYERGDLGMADLLNMAGRKSDVRECGIDCSAFYLLLNEIDGGGPILPSDQPLADRVQEQFAPFGHFARGYIPLLPPNR